MIYRRSEEIAGELMGADYIVASTFDLPFQSPL